MTAPQKFGTKSPPILDSGAGRHICKRTDLPDYVLEKSDHPGFKGAGGEPIPVQGKALVRFKDNFSGHEASATFLVAPVTRPIYSTGEICDKWNIAINSSRGAFVVSD